MKNNKMAEYGKLGGLATKANKPRNYYKIIGAMGGKAKGRAYIKGVHKLAIARLAK